MHNDSIDTLLARHYGTTATAPAQLEQRLCSSVRQRATALQQEQGAVSHLHTSAVSRRRAMQLVALGSVGLGIVNLGLEGLQALEASITGQEVLQSAP